MIVVILVYLYTKTCLVFLFIILYLFYSFMFAAESDLTAFSLKTEHFKSKQVESKNLLSADNRPAWVKRLYEQAGVPSKVYTNKPHVHRLSRRKRSLDDSCLPNDIELRKVRIKLLILLLRLCSEWIYYVIFRISILQFNTLNYTILIVIINNNLT